MRFYILTLFPAMFDGPFSESLIGKARRRGVIETHIVDIRDFASDRHRSVDDYPFGGGAGMVMKPEPIFAAEEHVRQKAKIADDDPIILLTPQGRPLTQNIVENLARLDTIVMICGRYEGVDERVRQELVTDEISVGDYVLAGGEPAAIIVVDAVSRLIPGVVRTVDSIQNDSFTTGLLQYPQYTRPAEFRGLDVPRILLSGNHDEIAKWRRRESLIRTRHRRPDLFDIADMTDNERRMIEN